MSATNIDLTDYINENFGANASYVQGLLTRYQVDPKSVDESWQTFFSDLISGSDVSSTAPRLDFSSMAILPDGRVAVSFNDSKHTSPAVAIEPLPAPVP